MILSQFVNRFLIKAANKHGTPLYVYYKPKLAKQVRVLKKSISVRHKVFYAVKANSNLAVIKALKQFGVDGIDAVSPGEVLLALEAGFEPEQIMFTGNNITDKEMRFVAQKGLILNIDSLSRLEKFVSEYGLKSQRPKISVRISTDCGAGHHDHCITDGPYSKFGIHFSQINEIFRFLKEYKLNLSGVHNHIGSQILDPDKFLKAVKAVFEVARQFPNLEFVDIGGGLGIPYKPNIDSMNIAAFGKMISQEFSIFCHKYGWKPTLILEPGRYLVGEAGYLVIQVNTIKINTYGRRFIGTDAGFNDLIRPAMYGSYHHIVNLSNPQGKRQRVWVCGNLCESGDVFARARWIEEIREGDYLAICCTGAYGFSMASNYNTRLLPAEVMIDKNGRTELVRCRQTFNDLIRSQKGLY